MRKVLMFMSFVLFAFCSGKVTEQAMADTEEKMVIDLKWYQNYPTETKENIHTGLKWILSYLGAMDPEKAIQWQSETIVQVNIKKAGFSKEQEDTWALLLPEIKSRTNYKTESFLDVGLFSLLTFNNSWHYYALTNMPKSFEGFKRPYDFDDGDQFIVAEGESCVSKGIRKLHAAKARTIDKIAHLSIEGIGKELEDFVPKEFEVFDYMPNGQPRYAIYDIDGQLLSGAKEDLGIAGKPAKCMWCHSSVVSKLIFTQTETEGYATIDEYSEIINKQNNLLWTTIQRDLPGKFLAEQAEEHSYAELLYIAYAEPTFHRLRNEGYKDELENWKKETHTNDEYKFMDLKLDSVISRRKIDPSFNITGREYNKGEVNYLSELR